MRFFPLNADSRRQHSYRNKTERMEVTRTFDLLEHGKEKYPRADALAAKYHGEWKCHSTNDFIEQANYFSSWLLSVGMKKGDKIATIFSNNQPEWNFAEELIDNSTVIARIQKEINTINSTLGQVEQIKKFKLITEEW